MLGSGCAASRNMLENALPDKRFHIRPSEEVLRVFLEHDGAVLSHDFTHTLEDAHHDEQLLRRVQIGRQIDPNVLHVGGEALVVPAEKFVLERRGR